MDYDNDGNLDLFLTSTEDDGFAAQNELFHNNGDGTFKKMTPTLVGPIASLNAGGSEGPIWADYDRDGFVDLFIARYGPDWLFHNNGNGTFTKMTNTVSGLVPDDRDSYNAMWGDYDHDGWPDLYVAVKDDTGRNQTNFFYHNLGNGTFTRIVSGQIATDNEHSMSCAWVDYDNDGNLDLFVVNGNFGDPTTDSLYHNNGDGTFTKMTAAQVGDIVAQQSHNVHCTWGDYDNDGYIDVYVTNPGDTKNNAAPEPNFLYHNNGDGSFTRVLTGSPANDAGNSVGCAWGDYDNDGFLDLFVARGSDIRPATNLLYRNTGNSNAWIKVKLTGTVSNRSAIGAKVRVLATIRGKQMWQMREINTGQGFAAGDLIAHFGLGDATNVSRLRVEWPSGIVEEHQNIAVKQSLTLTEPVQTVSLRGVGPLDQWTQITPLETSNPVRLFAIAYGGGQFVAAGDESISLRSSDGSACAPHYVGVATGFPLSETTLSAVAYGNNRFVAVSFHGPDVPSSILTSPDGVNWDPPETDFRDYSLNSIAYGGGKFVVVGGGLGQELIAVSTNGIDWSQVQPPIANGVLTGVTYGNGLFVIVADSGAVLTSTDALNWNVRRSGPSGQLSSVTFGEGQFVAVGGNLIPGTSALENTILTSADGTNWVERQSGITNVQLTGVSYGDGQFVAVGFGDYGTILSSPDGTDWGLRYSGPVLLNGVAYGSGRFVAVGDGGMILESGATDLTLALTGDIHSGMLTLRLNGSALAHVTVETSSDLLSWHEEKDVTLDANGSSLMALPTAANGHLFYRAFLSGQ